MDLMGTFQSSLTRNMPSTGSVVIDMVLTSVLLMIVKAIVDNSTACLQQWRLATASWLRHLLPGRGVKVVLTSELRETNGFSIQFNNNEVESVLVDIQDKSQQQPTDMTMLQYRHKLNNHKNFVFIPELPVQVTPDILCQVSSKVSHQEKNSTLTTLTVTLTGKSKKTIFNYIETITKAYSLRAKEELYSNQKFVRHHQVSEGSRVAFKTFSFSTCRTFANVFFDDKQRLLKAIDCFVNNKAWYDKNGIPHHFGLLLHGPPGTGKTSLVKAIANELNYHVINVNLAEVNDGQELIEIFHTRCYNCYQIPTHKRLFLFEDVDCCGDVVKRRTTAGRPPPQPKLVGKNKTKFPCLQTLTLSDLLNVIDGFLEMPGRIVIFTSNHPDSLDPALIRPGRVDMTLKLSCVTPATFKEMFEWFYHVPLPPGTATPSQVTPAKVMTVFMHNKDCYKDALINLNH